MVGFENQMNLTHPMVLKLHQLVFAFILSYEGLLQKCSLSYLSLARNLGGMEPTK